MRLIPPNLLPSKILLVDDNPANLDLLDMVLDFAGFTDVDSTTQPTEVMAMQAQKNYDLVLTDLRMPVMDGFALLEALRAAEGGDFLPILVISAQTDAESRLRALELGATDFLNKPFDQVEVVNRVVNMLTTRHLFLRQMDTNHHLEQKVAERTQALQETISYVISCLGRAAEFRDNETGLHVMRMSNYCARMAHALGKDASYVELFRQASTMHDVGKIGISDGILLKPGRLSADEFKVMKDHAQIGAEILGGSDNDLMTMARSIAQTHHEKWDGSGYPAGLSGEDIPIEGRIVAICDVFDALTTQRPYKHAWPVDEAVDFIKSTAGSHFDASLVEVFLSVLPDILILKEKFKEPPSEDEIEESQLA
jgi:putative two-component system response regulator